MILSARNNSLPSRAVTIEEHQRRDTTFAVAKTQLAVDERRVAVVENQLQLLEVRLQDMVVRAPYDGRVVKRHAEPGEWIHPGEPFVTLISSGQIEAWLDVPERFAPTHSQEQLRVVVAGIDEPIVSISTKVVPDVDARTRTFPLVLTLDDEQGRLSPGMSVDAWLPVGERRRRLAISKDAVVRSGRSAYVYKAVERQGVTVAVQVPIVIAFETGDAVILAGDDLAEGDRVVVEGNERLMPGAPIIVASPARVRLQGDDQYVIRER